jgi:hypothetical protein
MTHYYIVFYDFSNIITLANTTCKLPEDGVLTPKHVGVILIQIYTIICAYVGVY